jgi:hypothetical protein
MSGPRIYYNNDLMKQIWKFDPTYHNYFTNNFVINSAILYKAHSFWYEKYVKYLHMYQSVQDLKAIKYILEIQNGFYDTLEQVSPEFFINENDEA